MNVHPNDGRLFYKLYSALMFYANERLGVLDDPVLPIVYQDDCQICSAHYRFIESQEVCYVVEITFLDPHTKAGGED